MSQEGEVMDPKFTDMLKSLQLHKKNGLLLSSVELQNSLGRIRDAVIVSTFVDVSQPPQPPAAPIPDADSTETPASTVTATATTTTTTITTTTDQRAAHDEKIFNLTCVCAECSRHRETIIQLYVEDLQYNKLWEQVQDHLLDIYGLIPNSPDSACYKKYQELMQQPHSKWLSDGCLDVKNNIRLSLAEQWPIDFDMAFIYLYNRDPHQLLELLCMQIEAIVQAYADGLSEIVHNSAESECRDYDPCTLLNYIFDGYTKICHFEGKSTSCYHMEAGHMLQFRTSLGHFFKRQYQRWVYEETKKLMPDCVQKLKKVGLTDVQYQAFVRKYMKFEEAMKSVRETWRDVWLLLHKYHKTKDEMIRRRSIVTVHAVFLSIRDSGYDIETHLDTMSTLMDWITVKDRPLLWQYVVHKIKSRWQSCKHPRLIAKLLDVSCSRCKSSFVPHSGACQCRSCLIGGAPVVVDPKAALCCKCRFFENFKARGQETSGVYHLAWAVFKHLQGRTAYTAPTLLVPVFCVFQDVPCTRLACQIAANIIAQVYPPNFSKYLLTHYKPGDETTRKSIMKLENIDVRQLEPPPFDESLSAKLHPLFVLDQKWCDEKLNTEDAIKRASALAEGFLKDFPMPSRTTLVSNFTKFFRVTSTDIEVSLDLTKLEEAHTKKVLKRKERSDASDDKPVDGEIRKPLVEALQLSATNRHMERDLMTLKKEQARLSHIVKHHEKLHEEKHHSDPDSNDSGSKGSHRSEGQCICYYCTIFGQNDCAHSNRANETRERLRKRLQKSKRPVTKPAPPPAKPQDPISLKNSAAAVAAYHHQKLQQQQRQAQQQLQQQQQQQQHQQQHHHHHPPPPALPKLPVVAKLPPTPISCAPVDDILKFIEGGTESKKDKEAAARRAQKKRKQQLRKVELQKVDELNALKLTYDESGEQVESMRRTIKSLKKRKNKTRLHDTEAQLKTLVEKRAVMLTTARKLILSIQDLNPEFTYELEPTPVPVTVTPEPPQVTVKKSNCEISMDQEKRMVTIRRINVPNIPEPQVTVTAKGTTPDKDQLLYTFINGQLVPASAVNQEMYQQVKAQTSPTYPANYFQPSAERRPVVAPPLAAPVAPVEAKKPEQPAVRSKKITAGVQKMQEQIRKQQEKLAEMQREKQRKEERRQNHAAKVPPAPVEEKNNKKKKEEGSPVDATKKGKKKKVDEVKEEPKKTSRRSKQERRQQIRPETPEEKPVIREKKKTTTYIDPQFDNNAFKLLNLDESETEEESDESDEGFVVVKEEPKKKVETPPPPPSAPPAPVKEKKIEKKIERKKSVDEPKKKQQPVKQPEPVKEAKETKKQSQPKKVVQPQTVPVPQTQGRNSRCSIMDQLNQGVEVEGLKLPPGITLTRVDSAAFEKIKAKKESISKLSQPLKQASPPIVTAPFRDTYMMVNPMAHTQDPIIMVDTPKATDFEGKKTRRRNRKKKNKPEEPAKPSGIVTLRNPIFNQMPQQNLMPPVGQRPPVPHDQPAAIIKNEDGMYTIRNVALQHELDNGKINNLPHYDMYRQANNRPTDVPYGGCDEHDQSNRKLPSAIGSELKTAHKMKESAWAQYNLTHAERQRYQQTSLYPGSYGGVSNWGTNGYADMGYDGDVYNGNNYNPDPYQMAQQMHPSTGSAYYDNSNRQTPILDEEFLQNLQPGRRLNNEVTIHDVKDARVRNQPQQSNGVEITRIPSASQRNLVLQDDHYKSLLITQNNALNDLANHSFFKDQGLGVDDDCQDNTFATSTDVDMEAVNNSSYPFIFPPYSRTVGQGAATGKQQQARVDSPPSSLFGGEISSLSSTTPPSSDDLYTGSISDCPMYYDHDRNASLVGGGGLGVIGGELRTPGYTNTE